MLICITYIYICRHYNILHKPHYSQYNTLHIYMFICIRPSFFNYLDHNPARPCWNTHHKIKSSFSFYFYISRRPYFYIRIYTIKQITRNQISSTCAHHWNNSQQFMCCREFFYFDPTDPTFLQHFIFFIPNRPTWFFCNNFFRDPSNKKMMALPIYIYVGL